MYSCYFKKDMTETQFIKANIKACIYIAEYFNDDSVKEKMFDNAGGVSGYNIESLPGGIER